MFNLIQVLIISGCMIVVGWVGASFWHTIDKARGYLKDKSKKNYLIVRNLTHN